MKSNTVNPTNEFYGQLQHAYDHFNQDLFGGQLPSCLITVQREKNTTGFFSPKRWSNARGYQAHEIALHPGYFINRKLIDIFQTLVHEQCHLWQHEFGSPSRTGYHNQEWAEKMKSIGLVPSMTGQPGGKSTGQKMSDYPDENGAFKNSCLKLISTGFEFQWVDRRPAKSQEEHVDAISSRKKKGRTIIPCEDILYLRIAKTICNFDYLPQPDGAKLKVKVKYHCCSCGANVWGKHGLNIRCEECKNLFAAELS